MHMLHASIFLIAAALCGALSGCGGKVVLDASGGAGGAISTSSAGGAGGAISTSSAGGAGGAGACPISTPSTGDPCSSPGLECPYSCGSIATCIDGAWQTSMAICPP
jgi:hypothetical protein